MFFHQAVIKHHLKLNQAFDVSQILHVAFSKCDLKFKIPMINWVYIFPSSVLHILYFATAN